MNKKHLTILGSTGSIGRQALDVVAQYPDQLEIYALVCGHNLDLLLEQAQRFSPKVVAIGDPSLEKPLRKALKGTDIEVCSGEAAICEVAGAYQADMVLSAMVGFAGLAPTIAAIQSGKQVALANKETLVVAGEIIRKLCREHRTMLLPVDSEHSAIFQCLAGEEQETVRKLYLTASGGPFVDTPREDLANRSVEEALHHPRWNMGAKVTIDSATLMNKGLEMIEAHHLFGIAPEQIEVLVHRQSIIHSMVGFRDGSIKAQLALPDMRLPIAYALLYPNRLELEAPQLPTWQEMAQLTFEPPRQEDFPCLGLAYEAIEVGGTLPCVMNAANEIAVARFLKGEVTFGDIPKIVAHTMDRLGSRGVASLAQLQDFDREARDVAQAYSVKISRPLGR